MADPVDFFEVEEALAAADGFGDIGKEAGDEANESVDFFKQAVAEKEAAGNNKEGPDEEKGEGEDLVF